MKQLTEQILQGVAGLSETRPVRLPERRDPDAPAPFHQQLRNIDRRVCSRRPHLHGDLGSHRRAVLLEATAAVTNVTDGYIRCPPGGTQSCGKRAWR